MAQRGVNKVVVFVVFLVFVAAGVFIVMYLQRTQQQPDQRPGREPAPPAAADRALTPEQPTPENEQTKPAAEEPSDDKIRLLTAALSGDAEVARWLLAQHLLGKFVAVVENISRGQSPRRLLDFMAPEGKFETIRQGDKEFLDPKSYHRYDLAAGAFASLDARKCAEVIDVLYPWLNRKYKEMAEPGQDFRKAMAKAIAELLRVPVVEGDIQLETKAVAMKMTNEALEALSEAQMHLFRMGPDNIRKVQTKLREIGRALGLSKQLEELGVTP